MTHRGLLLLAGLSALSLCGCATPVPVDYLTLTTARQDALRRTAATISVAPVTLPDYLKRSGLARRDAVGALHYSATELWAEPLDHAIQRTLVENLADGLGDARVLAYPTISAVDADYSVSVVIRRMEATDSTVELQATWQIYHSSAPGETAVATGRFSADRPLGSGAGPAVARGYSELLQALAREMAAGVPEHSP